MARPNEALMSFLDDHPITTTQQLDAAMVFAQSMVWELQTAVQEWEVIVRELHDLKRQGEAEGN